MIVVSLIGLTNMMSAGMPEEWFWYLIPVYNTAQCLYGVFSMDYQMVPVVITCVINLLYSGVLVALLSKMFDSERIMYT
jgi:sodium transport system permease protein